MRILLVADREPYRSFALPPEQPYVLEVRDAAAFLNPSPPHDEARRHAGPKAQTEADLLVMPVELFLKLSETSLPGPVLAYGSTELMAQAFRAGCLDYLREPWDLAELCARSSRLESLRVHSGRFDLELRRRLLLIRGPLVELKTLELTVAEERLLRILMLNAGEPVPRPALAFALWDEERGPSRAIDTHISCLRKKLEAAVSGSASLLKSSRGRGYRLLAEACA